MANNRFELPVTMPIKKVIEEAEGIKSIILPYKLNARPGQFVMIWLPGIDAKPMSISCQDKSSFGITVAAVGEWSRKVCEMKEGELLGVMGPYGNPFKLEGEKIVLVGGGCGTASLMLLAEEALKKRLQVTMIIGAKSSKYLLYRERTRKLGLKTTYATDDGSFGEKGFVTDILQQLLSKEKFDKVYACGPEVMELKVAQICKQQGITCEISVERYMKCGFGVCGACSIDPEGKRVCIEGTVFSGEELLKTEFGKYRRDGSATKQKFGTKPNTCEK